MNLGGAELLIVAAVIVLVFGAGWLPKAAKNLGKAKVEMDKAQKQFNDAKNTAVEATGIKELEATIGKANKVLNSSPKKLMKDAAKTATTGGAAKKTTDRVQDTPAETTSDGTKIEDAEIVEQTNTPSSNSVNVNPEFE